MNILFLDIDGVLNSRQWHSSENCKILEITVKRFFDPACVEYLNKIVNETETKVVISSSWRILRSLQNLQDLFKSIGFTGKIFGKTEDLSIFEPDTPNLRGVEIQNWIKDNQKHFKTPIKYVIIDDENEFFSHQEQFFFQTNPDIGLDTTITEKIITFFK
ncbi:HAD domain-containing protein [Tenacibaculum sp. XPcli2-G]|uniref:HAD domain-containing protein n=1 Tax=Tenacibaculum sp. XPcli2-G TaxID=2954503 RepID=UPI0020972B57|nr:HAD domain-containing protein [Tenacibaculum sp. XPcli2-G]MCO7186091.1 HAD domain-containing protein [Tenacibaculum sp. XPcli2-G]